MDLEFWARAKSIFNEAASLAPSDRDGFLDEVCAGQAELRSFVLSLLEADGDLATDGADLDRRPEAADSPVGGRPGTGSGWGDALDTETSFGPDSLVAGRFRVLRPLPDAGPSGGFVAQDVPQQRMVELRFLDLDLKTDRGAVEAFERDSVAVATLDHPNISNVHEVFESEDARLVIVTDYYEGEILDLKIRRGALSVQEAIDIAIGAATGLQAAHGIGVDHGDLGSGSLLITGRGGVKIREFGVARLLEPGGRTSGSPAPIVIDERRQADIRSLAVILLEMLVGRVSLGTLEDIEVPGSGFEVDSQASADSKTILTTGVRKVLAKALSDDPTQRYSDAGQLASDLMTLRGRSMSGSQGAPASALSQRSRGLLVGAALFVVLLVSLTWTLRGAPGLGGRIPGIGSLAVLPLENLSGDPSELYFADGMTEALTEDLGSLVDLRVSSISSTLSLRDSEMEPAEIGRRLGVEALLQGSVIRVGDSIRLQATLTRAGTSDVVWTGSIERHRSDVLEVTAALVSELANGIGLTVSGERLDGLIQRRQVVPRAHDLYFEGLFAWRREPIKGVATAKGLLEEAIVFDPEYGAARAALAEILLKLSDLREMSREDAYAEAREHLEKAVTLDPRLPGPHSVLMKIAAGYDWEWDEAERHILRALELGPSLAESHRRYAHLLISLERFDEALEQLELSRVLDPFSPRSDVQRVTFLYVARRFDEAIAEARAQLDTYPTPYAVRRILGRCYLQQGRIPEAIEALGQRLTADLAYAYALAGRTEEAEFMLGEIRRRVPTAAYDPALILIALDRHGEALDLLEDAYRKRSRRMAWMGVDPQLDPIRDEPRFQAVLELVGLSR